MQWHSWLLVARPAVSSWQLQLCWISLFLFILWFFSPPHTDAKIMVVLLTCEVRHRLFHLGGNDFKWSHAADTTPITCTVTAHSTDWGNLGWLKELLKMVLRSMILIAIFGFSQLERSERSWKSLTQVEISASGLQISTSAIKKPTSI